MKAIILAAGRGERMRPLTSQTPKPLVRVGDTTLIEHALYEVRKAGIKDVVINVHHLADQIMQHCGDGTLYDLRIHYSIETELLNTGGGIYHALPMLGDSPFIALSADVWTDYPLSQLVHKKIDVAHMVLVNNPDFHAEGDFGLDEKNIVQNDAPNKFTYANIAVLHPRVFCDENTFVFPLSRVLRQAIAKGVVTGELFLGEWHNVGTMVQLEQLRAIFSTQKPLQTND